MIKRRGTKEMLTRDQGSKVKVTPIVQLPALDEAGIRYREENRNEKSAALLRSRPFTVIRLKAENLEFADPRYKECWFASQKWARRMITGTRDLYGVVSEGTSSILASAARAYAKAMYFEVVGAEDGDREALVLASKFAIEARMHQVAAHELAAREAKAFVKTAPPDQLPWLVGDKAAAVEVSERRVRTNQFRKRPIGTSPTPLGGGDFLPPDTGGSDE